MTRLVGLAHVRTPSLINVAAVACAFGFGDVRARSISDVMEVALKTRGRESPDAHILSRFGVTASCVRWPIRAVSP
jgi:hypothetical protein